MKMKKRRILITLDLCYGLNVMLYEYGLTKQQISIDSPALKGLSLREFCMLTKEKILSAEGMTPNELSFIERLLGEYSLRLGMPDTELKAYLNQYYRENPEEKEFYDLCDRICGITPNTDSANRSETTVEEMPAFDEEKFRQEMDRQLHSNPMNGKRLGDLGWLRYQSVQKAYLCQPWYMRWFCCPKARMKRAIKEVFCIYEIFCLLTTESCIESERKYFENKEKNPLKEH